MGELDLSRTAWRKASRSGSNGGACVEVAAAWRKSSRSGDNGGECVELAAAWRKAGRSGGNGGDCVEVAAVERAVVVRDSKDPGGVVLAFSAGAWRAFVGGLK